MATLFLIPTSLLSPITKPGILEHQIDEIKHLTHFIVETAKIGRAHLKALSLNTPICDLDIQELNKHQQDLRQLMSPLLAGNDVGLLSDCGMPGIADPGNIVVKEAHKLGITVKPLAGASSLLMALMASGVNGQNFAFVGYLPVKQEMQQKRIKALELLVKQNDQSQIMIEAPFRNNALLKSLVANLDINIQLSISVNLMCENEYTMSQPISQWRKMSPLPDLHKQEVVFVIGDA